MRGIYIFPSLYLYRGDEFRVSFAEIGTLRSIIPPDINILALITATASTATLDAVISRVALKDPVVIGTSPNHPNIFYSLGPDLSLLELSGQLSSELMLKNVNTPKTIVFCQSFVDCYKLYEGIEKAMKEKFTYPPDYPDMHQFRLVEMYHSGCMTCSRSYYELFYKGSMYTESGDRHIKFRHAHRLP